MSTERGDGVLFLVGTPIGNLEDMTIRGVRVLREEAEIIAAEDTRRTRALCSHFGIHKRVVSYHEHNEESAARRIVKMLKEGRKVALVSDAGMPGLSDPGCRLVTRCLEEGIRVVPVPGPSAAVTALVVSGLCKNRFIFEGFLPRERGKRLETLKSFAADPRPVVVYESPRRVGRTLQDIAETLGPRTVVVAREMTKVYEEIIRAPAAEAARIVGASPRGEFTVVIAGADAERQPPGKRAAEGSERGPVGVGSNDIAGDVENLVSSGVPRMDAIKRVARTRGLTKRQAYSLLAGRSEGPPAEGDGSE
ncbi:MAG: 16S rRNA (cytidine(1402)-2'-O)-methyltransferase [Firmicutes bacterium]|nr:16S rRNA (cytidine(1402)-2'-O)-methyltransferase [Bacillota bacterium]